MSLRPEISGFRLDVLNAVLGRGDDSQLPALVAELDAFTALDDPARRDRVVAILRRAVQAPPRWAAPERWADVEAEGDDHVLAAQVLARHGQEHLETGSNVWNMTAFWTFIEERFASLPKPGRKYLAMFGAGRGLFARKVDAGWGYYGYLALPELQQLLASLREYRAAVSAEEASDPGSRFADELVGWLGAIESAGLDLWFSCD